MTLNLHWIGDEAYHQFCVVEQDGVLYGPFFSQGAATAFADARLELPFTVRALLTPAEAVKCHAESGTPAPGAQ